MRLEVHTVSKRFGGLHALDDVSFTAKSGELTALIGPNGAGKTTMFNCISGSYPLTAGEVRLGGTLLTGMRPAQVLTHGLARTFQLVRPFEGLTVLETVMTSGHWRSGQTFWGAMLPTPAGFRSEKRLRTEAMQTLAALGVDHLADQHVHQLPYGQQRLVEIAKVLATGADTLLLDEPAAGLHATELEALSGVLIDIRRAGRTILMVEHNMAFLMSLADRVVVLDFGRKLAEGTPEEVNANQDVIDAYLGKGTDNAKS
ncbi:ABC transporter ATP-binding protein [Cryobacterium sp. Y82]|uniref:ABC transporter ATP-binding protein n=1 Tax=Cryobacterium sp. Y82 TaxID=2045017 RepID=UPI000CE3A5DF|nr:ABC transporter ATP-binding protein [Cryobacterium sp. Y82]